MDLKAEKSRVRGVSEWLISLCNLMCFNNEYTVRYTQAYRPPLFWDKDGTGGVGLQNIQQAGLQNIKQDFTHAEGEGEIVVVA